MFNWAKQQLANVAGTQEPIYGPSAIQTVSQLSKDVTYTELKKEDLKWTVMDSTNVETHTFYFTADNGHLGMAQIIYSNVAGIRTTCQFNSKILYPNQSKPALWSSKPLEEYEFDDEKYSFLADNCSIELSPDGTSYGIKSATDENALVNIKVSRAAPGFQAGTNGTSNFGTDPEKPWGRMKHVFWPKCDVEGAIITKDGEVDFKGRGLFIHCLQGMKPHHAAAKWNFVNFQSPDYTAVLMEYTTPPSYGSTVVTVGGILRNEQILTAGSSCSIKHTEIRGDDENDWPEPGAIAVKWDGKSKDGNPVGAELSGSLGPRLDRIDVMAEVPGFVKAIVASAAGTKPYIYQFGPKVTLKVTEDGKTTEQEGRLFMEATFISE